MKKGRAVHQCNEGELNGNGEVPSQKAFQRFAEIVTDAVRC